MDRLNYSSGLLVEDSSGDARLIIEFMKSEWGPTLKMKSAQTLQGGLSAVGQERFDFILLDLSLPDCKDYETFRKMNECCNHTPILVMTGLDDKDLAEKCVREGAQDYLVKGQFDQVSLVRAIRFSLQRKEYLKGVQISENSFKNIMDQNKDGIIIVDKAMYIRYVNSAACDIFEEKKEKVIGRRFDTPLTPGEETEVHLVRQGQAAKVVSMVVTEIEWEGASSYLGSLRDVTKKKMLQAVEMREKDDKYAQLFEKSTDGIVVYDLNGNIVEINQKARVLLGINEKDISKMNMFTFLGTDGKRQKRKPSKLMIDESEDRFEMAIKRVDGKIFNADIITSIVRLSNQKVIQSIIRDITERKQLEERLRESNRELLQLESLRDQLVHSIVHDIRGPLTANRGTYDYLSVLIKNGKLRVSDNIRKQIISAQRSCELQMGLIDDILDVSRIQNYEFPLKKKKILIPVLISQCIDIVEPLSHQCKVSIKNKVKEGIEALVDDNVFKRVLINILQNAIKYSPNNGTIMIQSQSYGEGQFELSVRDEGLGIDNKNIKKIFDKFFQSNGSSPIRKGQGLGLAFCKMAIEAHGGRIVVENNKSKGATFKIYLPIK